MEAGEPSRKKKATKQLIVEVFGTAIALTTLTLPILLIINLSNQNNSNPSPPSPMVNIP